MAHSHQTYAVLPLLPLHCFFLPNHLSLMVYGPGAQRQCCCWQTEHSAGSSKVDAVSLFEDEDLKVLCGKARSLCCWLKQINHLICMTLSFPRCFVLTLNYTWIRLLFFFFFLAKQMPLLAQIRYNDGFFKTCLSALEEVKITGL